MPRTSLIRVFADVHGTWYCGTKERLISAGLATAAMFPENSEMWRGNGPVREGDEPLWAVSRTTGPEYLVLRGTADKTKTARHR
ncbi:MAG: hypothetical protein ACT4NU_01035 [Chromatiales bacterium]